VTMKAMNNTSAALALNELNKNNNKLSKDLKKVSSGMRITGAGDSAADYAISEKMRVLTRALNQDIDNSKKGIDLVKVAEGGIQSIIDELRNMKAMALDSANGHNNEVDRSIIQKEFASRIEEINDIASTTEYNGIILLDGRWRRYKTLTSSEGETVKVTSQTVDSDVSTTLIDIQTLQSVTTIKTSPTTKKVDTDVKTEIVDSPPEDGETTNTSIITSQPVISTKVENPEINVISIQKEVGTPSVTTENDITTVVNNEQIITKKSKITSNITTETTTTTKTTTTVRVTVEEVKNDEQEEIIIINNGTTSIDKDGLYEFAPDFTGELTITAKKAQLNGPQNGSILKDVYIKDSGVEDLYIKNLNIENHQDISTIAFNSANNNVLHILGNNSISTSFDNSTKAIINAGGGLNIVGGGSISLYESNVAHNAKIGSDQYGSCGDIVIGQKVNLSIVKKIGGSSGAGIGSGSNGTCGNILIGSDAKVYIDMNIPTAGTAIGSGDTYEHIIGCKDIIIYSRADVEVKADRGAGIGSSALASGCGNITIYSDAKVKASSNNGAAIGGGDSWGQFKNTVGNITIYSYSKSKIITTSDTGEEIGTCGNPLGTVDSVNLIGTRNYTEGGILDLSELSLSETHEKKYKVTTTTFTTTEVTQTITETKNTTIETFEDEETNTTTTIYEKVEKSEADIILGDPLIIHTGPKANQNLPIYINDMRPDAIGLTDVAVDPIEKALEAIDKLDDALEYALNENTTMGAYQSRLNEIIDNLTAEHENTITSESVIRDADMAREMTNYIKDNILSQTSQAMLANANQSSSSVLSLLQ